MSWIEHYWFFMGDDEDGDIVSEIACCARKLANRPCGAELVLTMNASYVVIWCPRCYAVESRHKVLAPGEMGR